MMWFKILFTVINGIGVLALCIQPYIDEDNKPNVFGILITLFWIFGIWFFI